MCHPDGLLGQDTSTAALFVPMHKKIDVKMVQNTVTIGLFMLHHRRTQNFSLVEAHRKGMRNLCLILKNIL
jgi:hypothetical protein